MNWIIINHVALALWVVVSIAIVFYIVNSPIVLVMPFIVIGGVFGIIIFTGVLEDRQNEKESREMKAQYEKDAVEFGRILWGADKEAKA